MNDKEKISKLREHMLNIQVEMLEKDDYFELPMSENDDRYDEEVYDMILESVKYLRTQVDLINIENGFLRAALNLISERAGNEAYLPNNIINAAKLKEHRDGDSLDLDNDNDWQD